MAQPDNSSPHPARRGRLMRIVLVASLALNLLVLGVLAGGMWKAGQMQRAGSPSDLRALWQALPEASRRDMRPADAQGPEGRAAQREERRAQAAARQAEMLSLLRAPEFDADAFGTLLETEHSERSERIARASQAFVARVAELDAAERATVADRLEEGRGRRSPRR
ncbi:MAG: periplasmic heavy metal sensor [Pararhodobacter sp.]|nr:periplasmic heavy metal sensor [Pararhodobacter sp.]